MSDETQFSVHIPVTVYSCPEPGRPRLDTVPVVVTVLAEDAQTAAIKVGYAITDMSRWADAWQKGKLPPPWPGYPEVPGSSE